MTKRIKNVLDLTAIAEEIISISTFMNKTCENSKLDRVSINLKGASNFNFLLKLYVEHLFVFPRKTKKEFHVPKTFVF